MQGIGWFQLRQAQGYESVFFFFFTKAQESSNIHSFVNLVISYQFSKIAI